MTPKFHWGDTVRIAEEAPSHLRPGALGEVCGISSHHASIDTDCTQGSNERDIMYTIEFGDGTSVFIPEAMIEQPEE